MVVLHGSMSKIDLSILIPSRNEMFLNNTIEDILKNAEGNYEIIVGLDGVFQETIKNPKVTVIFHSESIGQRAITNQCAKLAKGKYLMKVDAHCAFDKGFDVKMISEMHDDWTMVPTMRNLHAFDWVCDKGHRRYQGPSGKCHECGGETKREIKWIGKYSPQSNAYRFDTDMHFQYWSEWGKEQKGMITETMSLQGSCFMCTKDKYFELDLCSEDFHSWGQQGVEVACKTWLSGGKVMVNRKTWYAHMFRTQGGDFSFPYHQPQSEVLENRKKSKELFTMDKWPKAKYKFQWLINKFKPPEWKADLTKGIVYYTDNRLDPKIMLKCQEQLGKAFSGRIVSVSLEPIDFGENLILPLDPGLLTMSKQILAGLEMIDTDIVFLCEHDVLYHSSHFNFDSYEENKYYYNTNSWMLRANDGHSLYYYHRSLSGMSAFRTTLITYFKERIRRIEALIKEANGTNIVKATSGNDIPLKEAIHRLGFEPGTHNRPERIDDFPAVDYQSEQPNIDIRHNSNQTRNRWSIDQFRDKSVAETWKESEEIPYWGRMVI